MNIFQKFKSQPKQSAPLNIAWHVCSITQSGSLQTQGAQ